jgi:hypothetical protein
MLMASGSVSVEKLQWHSYTGHDNSNTVVSGCLRLPQLPSLRESYQYYLQQQLHPESSEQHKMDLMV